MLVVFLQDQHILFGWGAKNMPPNLIRTHGLVGPRVEKGPAVGGPGGPVVDLRDDVGEVLARPQIAEPKLMALRAVDVDGVSHEILVGASLAVAKGGKLRAPCEPGA